MADPPVAADNDRLRDVVASAAMAVAALRRLAGADAVGAPAMLPGSVTAAVAGPRDAARRLTELAAELSEWARAVTADTRRLAGIDADAGDRIAGS